MNAEQAKKDDRDNGFLVRWGVTAVIVVALGALGYNYLARTGTPDTSPSSPPAQTAPATPSR